MWYWSVDWLNQNSQRNYPLADDATRTDTSNSFTLTSDLLLDFVFPVQNTSAVDPGKFHVHTVQAYAGGVSIAFGYDGEVAASVSIPRTHEYGQSYYVNGTADFADSTGVVAIGNISELAAGRFSFDLAGGAITPASIRPSLRGVSAVRVIQGAEESGLYTGDIELTAGRNVQFFVSETEDGYRLRIDALPDSQLGSGCECSTLAPKGDPIHTINGVLPIANNIDLVAGNDCLEIIPHPGRGYIELVNRCAESCCGCDELEVVVNDLRQMTNQINTLSNFASRLESSVLNLQQTAESLRRL